MTQGGEEPAAREALAAAAEVAAGEARRDPRGCVEGGEELHVYGAPGQDRFGFMRQWLLSFAVGALVLLDANDPTALDQAAQTLAEVQKYAPDAACVVLAARPASSGTLDRFAQQLAERCGQPVPLLAVDVRERTQMFDALELLAHHPFPAQRLVGVEPVRTVEGDVIDLQAVHALLAESDSLSVVLDPDEGAYYLAAAEIDDAPVDRG